MNAAHAQDSISSSLQLSSNNNPSQTTEPINSAAVLPRHQPVLNPPPLLSAVISAALCLLCVHLFRVSRSASSLPLLCDLVQQEAPQFDYLTTSHALYRLSILCHAYFTQLQSAHLTSREAQQAAWIEYVEPALQTLGQLLIRHMDELDAWGVAISFWAYGKLQCSDEAAFAALCERGLAIMDEFNAVDCASTLVGIARLRVRPRCQREFLEHLLAHTADLLSHVDAWSSQEVANVLWGLSKIGAAGPSRRSLLEGLLEMTLWRLEEFSVQQLAIVVYSCGRMRLRLPQQLAKITHHIAAQAQNMNPLDAAHVMWGCAKVDFTPGATLLERLPGVMVPRLSEFKPQVGCGEDLKGSQGCL